MARCSYHPNVETEMRCAECEKPICPKEMVLTPVGYKCPEHARPARGQYRFVKPHQMAKGLAAGVGAGVLGGLLLGAIPYGGFFIGILWGAAVAEAVRRGSGGHRGLEVGVIAVLGLAAGWIAGLFSGGVSFITTIVAAIMALAQLAVFDRR